MGEFLSTKLALFSRFLLVDGYKCLMTSAFVDLMGEVFEIDDSNMKGE